MAKLSRRMQSLTFSVVLVVTCTTARAQDFNTLVNFDQTDGAAPNYLVQGTDGDLYGTTSNGGTYGMGTIFKITPDGSLQSLHSFGNGDGAHPSSYAPLAVGKDGSLYGITNNGGCCGTVYKMDRSGNVLTLHEFQSNEGNPWSGVTLASNGNFYGTTVTGGNLSCSAPYGCGTIYQITATGKFSMLYAFCSQPNCSDGISPVGELIQATDGNLYGTTIYGGSCSGCGTVFRITLHGLLTTIHSFDSYHGAGPYGGLVQSSDGSFYGATGFGGDYGHGTVFKVTRNGTFDVLYSFICALPDCPDGGEPLAGLIQATDGNFYGTTDALSGTIFKISPTGDLTTVHTFADSDGTSPFGLLQATNGTFYGVAGAGGDFGDGTIFDFSESLGPFISFISNSGNVGNIAEILGQGLSGATEVSFNGTPARYRVISDTFVKAAVPAGASSGFVTVTAPTRTLSSNVPYRVTPKILSFDPAYGPVGTQVTITGTSLTQTTKVGFGDLTPAQFTVKSDTEITAVVPIGARIGHIGVETKSGIALSPDKFIVIP